MLEYARREVEEGEVGPDAQLESPEDDDDVGQDEAQPAGAQKDEGGGGGRASHLKGSYRS